MSILGGAAIAAVLVLALSILVAFDAGWVEIAILAVLTTAAIALCLLIVRPRSQRHSKLDE